MRPTRLVAALALVPLVAACDGAGPSYTGHNTWEYFPLDGERSWKYAMDDDSAGYILEVEKVSTAEQGGTQIATLEYRKEDTGDLLYSVQWSSDSAGGILIHGYEVQGGDSVDFDAPVQFADYRMIGGDTVETQTNGMNFASTLVGLESCPNLWTTEEWECLHMSLDDGDGDDMAGPPFAGDWWIAGSWGASRFQPTGWNADWVLTNAYFCDPDSQNCD